MDEKADTKIPKQAENKLKEAVARAEAFESSALDKPEPPLCSFCGRGVNQVSRMIEGNKAFICDSCIKQCQGLINK